VVISAEIAQAGVAAQHFSRYQKGEYEHLDGSSPIRLCGEEAQDGRSSSLRARAKGLRFQRDDRLE
jgi:hypothetical protein